MTKWLAALIVALCASVTGAVYIMPEMPNEPGPTPRFLLVTGYWSQSAGVCLASNPVQCSDGGPTWTVDYEAFDSVGDAGKRLAGRGRSWPNRTILGLWELGEANRLPIKTHSTAETVEKHIEVEERVWTTDHYQIGGEEFSSEPRR